MVDVRSRPRGRVWSHAGFLLIIGRDDRRRRAHYAGDGKDQEAAADIMTTRISGTSRDEAAARPGPVRMAWTLLRVVGSIAVLVTLYYVLPLDHSTTAATVTMLLIGLAGFVALFCYQVRTIIRSRYPALRAIEACRDT